jgi:site-specific DNA recombinase
MNEPIKTKRCAIYTRKSVEDGLEQEFNSLDAQRAAAEAYIASQVSNGWVCLPARYDDGGWSGGNIKRPALQQLLADAEAGKIDIIIVYKIDRLSRSICDFAELSNKFDQWNVSFVAVTQEINTSSSSGRMMLNILITFAQYEREVIAERVRDKMSASRKLGKWVGGTVPMGYVVKAKKLKVEPEEAEVIRRIFNRFLIMQSPKLIATELNADGVHTKQGKIWDTGHIYRILNNYTYIGEVNYKGEIFPGEHKAIIDREVWEKSRVILKDNALPLHGSRKIETIAPLRGILRCGHCDSAMTPTYTNKNGRRYNYYQCAKDRKRGIKSCPVGLIPAGEVERIVFDHLGAILNAPEIVAAVSRKTKIRAREVTAIFNAEFWNEITPGERNCLAFILIERAEVKRDELILEIKTEGVKSIIEEMKNGKD